ncbi:MAG TPA: hypothetical protein PLE54_07940 [Burkholderiaceae bacterium]|nr:hypothetical protein [Burkholderiaceae bacterium]
MNWTLFALVFGVAAVVFGIAICAMAIGVVARRPCLRGSCGGPAVIGPNGVKVSCGDCPNRTSPRSARARAVRDTPGDE